MHNPNRDSLPVSPGLEAVEAAEAVDLTSVQAPPDYRPIDRRAWIIVALASGIAILAALVAQFLTALIGVVTNLAFYGRWSTQFVSPAGGHQSPLALILVPIIGGLIVGVMARYGSAAIRGHGIPEVMERILQAESRISPRVLFLKPLSAAIAIGTGGPFGAEGPIIATGGALGSIAGQFLHVTTDERKTLLAAGAAAGMAATFGTPVSAVLLAVELLLFEYRPRSLVPVAMASAIATGIRAVFHGTAPVFPIPDIPHADLSALGGYAVIGVIIGICAAGITWLSYKIEDWFEAFGEHFHIHWMWWPAFGAIAVGVVGLIEPRTLGVGYENIIDAISGTIVGRALIMLAILKFVSWAIYLGSGTSGGTLAPLFTIGSALGACLGSLAKSISSGFGIDIRVAGLVGMAAIFAGASHALLASVVFAFETTRQPFGLLPIMIGSTAAFLTAISIGKTSIMTEKLARRGVPIRHEYSSDHLGHVLVSDAMSEEVDCLDAADSIEEVRATLLESFAIASHQGFPVMDEAGLLVGVVTRRDLLDPANDGALTVRDLLKRPPVVVFEDSTLRDAADQMVLARVGRLPVVTRNDPRRIVGIVSRSDLLDAHRTRLRAARGSTGVHRVVDPVRFAALRGLSGPK